MAEIPPATVLPVHIRLGGTSRSGWRATLVSGKRTVWRCSCYLHRDYDTAFQCGVAALQARQKHSEQRRRINEPIAITSRNLSRSGHGEP